MSNSTTSNPRAYTFKNSTDMFQLSVIFYDECTQRYNKRFGNVWESPVIRINTSTRAQCLPFFTSCNVRAK